MSIQRQYSLPNCNLILEGLSTASESPTSGDRPELSVLTRFECYFAREKQALIGGLDLLEGLLHATNDCVQSCISGIPSAPLKSQSTDQRVQIQTAQTNGFDLMVPAGLLFQSAPDATDKPDVHLHISTIQLFDLMEAMDQLTTDQRTLPTLQVKIQPRPRQAVMAVQSNFEQSAPIALGTAGVAVAAAAVFWLPAPKVPTQPNTPQTPATIERSGTVPVTTPPTTKPSPQ
jgi:hypothetical protein